MEVLQRYYRYTLLLAQWLVRMPFSNKPSEAESFSSLLSSEVFLHACKTPLSVLLCNLETAYESEINPELFRSSLMAANSLNMLIANIGSGNKEAKVVFDVSESIKNIIILVKSRFPDANIEYSVKNTLITGNKLIFQEAIQCLLVNAIEAQEIDNPRPLVILRQRILNQELIRIDIIDFGKGMSSAELRLACLKGISYKKSGTGQGLTFANKAIQNQFNGTVSISSSVGMGTRIMLEIPV